MKLSLQYSFEMKLWINAIEAIQSSLHFVFLFYYFLNKLDGLFPAENVPSVEILDNEICPCARQRNS